MRLQGLPAPWLSFFSLSCVPKWVFVQLNCTCLSGELELMLFMRHRHLSQVGWSWGGSQDTNTQGTTIRAPAGMFPWGPYWSLSMRSMYWRANLGQELSEGCKLPMTGSIQWNNARVSKQSFNGSFCSKWLVERCTRDKCSGATCD